MLNVQTVFAVIAALALAGCGGGGGGGDSGTGGSSGAAPTISAQPAAATVVDGGSASFSTAAAGNAPLTYQWRRNGTDLVDAAGVAGATSAALTLAAPYAFNASQISVRVANAAGSVVSNSALLTVTPIAPTITTQPATTSVMLGAPATFSALISGGTAPVTYQWKRNGAAIAGATSASYTTPATTLADNDATLILDVINPAGTLSSAAARLQILVAPTITKQPENLSVAAGAPATFSIEISGGTPPISVQWKRNGMVLGSEVARSYTIPVTEIADDGAVFTVDIFSSAGSLSSVAAILTVTPAGPGLNLTVNTTDDRVDDDTGDGVCHTSVNTCSLRAAIMQANHRAVPLVRINVPAGTYTLTRLPTGNDDESSGDLNLTTPSVVEGAILISGASAGTTVIDANQIDHAIRVSTGRIATLSGLTLRNGKAVDGAGIFNEGSLTVSECVIESSRADGAGGGIASVGTLKVIRSTIRSNNASLGGGMFLAGGTTVSDSTIHGNHARANGGGIFNDDAVYVVNSTVSQNTADGDGGGIINYGGTLVGDDPSLTAFAALFSTTVTDNDADHDRDENGGIGGGVFNKVGSLFVVGYTLIARNTLVDSPIYNDCKGALSVQDRSLFSDLGGCTLSGDGTAAVLSFDSLRMDTMLRNNGGPTLTLALLPGSLAIDPANEATTCIGQSAQPLTTDQRGAPRVEGAHCDVGAYEFGAVVP